MRVFIFIVLHESFKKFMSRLFGTLRNTLQVGWEIRKNLCRSGFRADY